MIFVGECFGICAGESDYIGKTGNRENERCFQLYSFQVCKRSYIQQAETYV